MARNGAESQRLELRIGAAESLEIGGSNRGNQSGREGHQTPKIGPKVSEPTYLATLPPTHPSHRKPLAPTGQAA